jgi:hypothetical protein
LPRFLTRFRVRSSNGNSDSRSGRFVRESGIGKLAAAGPVRDLVLEGPRSDTYSGTISSASPVWNRIYGCDVLPACAAICYDSGVDRQYYEVIPIEVTAAENLECEVTGFQGTAGDSTNQVYCNPFDPMQPLVNVVAYDHDDGPGYLSIFVAADGVLLQPGQIYYVFSPFDPGEVGNFTIEFTSATVHVVPVELQSFDVA